MDEWEPAGEDRWTRYEASCGPVFVTWTTVEGSAGWFLTNEARLILVMLNGWTIPARTRAPVELADAVLALLRAERARLWTAALDRKAS